MGTVASGAHSFLERGMRHLPTQVPLGDIAMAGKAKNFLGSSEQRTNLGAMGIVAADAEPIGVGGMRRGKALSQGPQ